MGSDKTDEHDFQSILDYDHQPVHIALDIKDNPIVRQDARIAI
jgi:hypothetical protein